MLKNYYNDIIVIFLVLIGYFILGIYLSINIDKLLLLEIPIFMGTILVLIVINFVFFGKKIKAEIISYSLGFGGSVSLSNGGRGRKYILKIKNNIHHISYASLSSYEKDDIVTVFTKNKKIILLRDILILLGASIFFLQFPIRYNLGLL